MNEKDFICLYKNALPRFYKKYYAGKNIKDAFYYSCRRAIKNLLSTQILFLMIKDCLESVKENKANYSSLSKKEQLILKKHIHIIKHLTSNIDKIFDYALNQMQNIKP